MGRDCRAFDPPLARMVGCDASCNGRKHKWKKKIIQAQAERTSTAVRLSRELAVDESSIESNLSLFHAVGLIAEACSHGSAKFELTAGTLSMEEGK